jgi:hypothetical protein
MQNIRRVILWGMPPLFCALAQRAGRASRDFDTLGEAILIVLKNVIKSGTSETEVAIEVQEAALNAQAENRNHKVEVMLEENGVGGMPKGEEINPEGERVAHGGAEDSEPEEEPEVKVTRKKKFASDSNILEARYLSIFVCTTQCRQLVWDEFFQNLKKCESRCTLIASKLTPYIECNSFILKTPLTKSFPTLAVVTTAPLGCFRLKPSV